MTVAGEGFYPGTTVTISVCSSPVKVAEAIADAHGRFSTVVRVPSDTTAGAHEIVAVGIDPSGDPHASVADLFVIVPTFTG